MIVVVVVGGDDDYEDDHHDEGVQIGVSSVGGVRESDIFFTKPPKTKARFNGGMFHKFLRERKVWTAHASKKE